MQVAILGEDGGIDIFQAQEGDAAQIGNQGAILRVGQRDSNAGGHDIVADDPLSADTQTL